MYDVLILISEQKKASLLKFDEICITATNRKSSDKSKLYYSFWSYINNVNGILYKIFTNYGLGEFECGDELFDFSQNTLSDDDIPYYLVNDSDIDRGDYIYFSVKESYKKAFFDIIDLLISKSPIETILFLCRGQSKENEIVLGKISKDKFLDMVSKEQVLTNICYIIG